MRLKDYLTEHGDRKLADLLDAKKRTVRSWRLGERQPHPRVARDIERVTEGAVTFSECFDE